jgi:ABC-type uncharacterized transport system ATPase subunit
MSLLIDELSSSLPDGPPLLEVIKLTKRFGPFTALDGVSLKLTPGSFHALLGENGAGKSTLVKCIMGYQPADDGEVLVGNKVIDINNPREAQVLGIGMVYQHFTLVPNMTVAENFVMSRNALPFHLDWKKQIDELNTFLSTMPFRVDPNKLVRDLAAGQKQKVEILKQLYLNTRILFLDEPTSVLTPQEADEILGILHQMTREKKLSILMITHKFREVMRFADEITVLRRGKPAGSGFVKDLTPAAMAEMMVGSQLQSTSAERDRKPRTAAKLVVKNLSAYDESGKRALKGVTLSVHGGEVVGIAGVSGNGQKELVEVLAGQRVRNEGTVDINGDKYSSTRKENFKHKVFCLPEEPLRNACVPQMSVSENIALRSYDKPPHAFAKILLNGRSIFKAGQELIERYKVKTPSPSSPIANLSGGNVQRAVLARELSGAVEVLIVANPVFGLDFAAVAEIHAQIMGARNRGAAVLLVSEDLDELFELSDRILVMYNGEVVYEKNTAEADLGVVGAHMTGLNHAAHEPHETKTVEAGSPAMAMG